MPTLVIGHIDDPFHRWPIAQTTAARIIGAQLVQVPARTVTLADSAKIDLAIHSFLERLTWS